MNVDSLLENYSPGRPTMKPDVLEQMVKMEEERRKQAEKMLAQGGGGGGGQQITMQQEGGDPIVLSMTQVVDIIKQQQGQLAHLKQVCDKLIKEQIEYKRQIKSQSDTISELQLLNADLTNKLKQPDVGVVNDVVDVVADS